jgi:Major Facilitator Superfamily
VTEPSPQALTRLWVPVAGILASAGWGSNQFTPLLLVYHARLGLSTATLEALFAAYAIGLIPGLVVAGRWSDLHGRRPVGVFAAVVSLLASASLIAGAHTLALLFAGRLLAGVSSGAAFGAGTAWLRETSLPPFGAADHSTVARRAAVAMTIGFALGPLVAGVLAQWAPAPAVVPYLPHIGLMVLVLVGLARVPETIRARMGASALAGAVRLPEASARRFRRLVVPLAPWVFAAPAIAFALLPSIVGTGDSADRVALTATITCLTALAGVLIQPLARRLEAGVHSHAGAVIGLLVLAAGLVLAALTAGVPESWLLFPCAIVLGSAYGLCLVAGLLEVQRLAPPQALARLTATFYVFTYLGFAVPYLLAVAAHSVSYSVLLLITGSLALCTAGVVARGGREQVGRERDLSVSSAVRPRYQR